MERTNQAHRAQTELMAKAVCSDNLKGRSASNQAYGTKDFQGWSRAIIHSLAFQSVLDICCGTGNQLVEYASRSDLTNLVGVDLSPESLQKAQERITATPFSGTLLLLQQSMEGMFSEKALQSGKFDLISCFYGLYYSQDVQKTLNEIVDHLSDEGSILIVGPYGPNNKTMFDILQKHFALPELVVRSATTFMEAEVLPALSDRCDIRTETFVNPVEYPNADAVMAYWRASTFYKPEYEESIEQDVKDVIARNRHFTIEKHVMACIARKK